MKKLVQCLMKLEKTLSSCNYIIRAWLVEWELIRKPIRRENDHEKYVKCVKLLTSSTGSIHVNLCLVWVSTADIRHGKPRIIL